MIFHSNKISYLASWSKLSKLRPSSNVQFWEELRMYNKLPIALGAALAVGVAGFAGGAIAKVEGDTIIIGSSLSLTGK